MAQKKVSGKKSPKKNIVHLDVTQRLISGLCSQEELPQILEEIKTQHEDPGTVVVLVSFAEEKRKAVRKGVRK